MGFAPMDHFFRGEVQNAKDSKSLPHQWLRHAAPPIRQTTRCKTQPTPSARWILRGPIETSVHNAPREP
jgi:hypothetical protein